jgi:hypothetical protein
MQIVSGEVAKQHRIYSRSKGTGEMIWYTDYIGDRAHKVAGEPHAFLAEQIPGGHIGAHFHHVDQFQVFTAGRGTLGRHIVQPLTLHYVDHHTAYGPIDAGPYGFAIFTIRARFDEFPVFLDAPSARDHLKPSRKRYLMAEGISLSTEPAMQSRDAVMTENLFPDADGSDGLAAAMLRMGAGGTITGSDPAATGGQYILVVNGSLAFANKEYGLHSLVHVTSGDAPLRLEAGSRGVELLALNFPRP